MTLDSARVLAFLLNGVVQVGIIAGGTAVALRLVRTARACVKYRIAVVGLPLCGAVPLLSAWPAARVDGLAIVVSPAVNTSAFADGHAASLLVGGYLTLVLWKIATLTRAALAYKTLRRTSIPITEGPTLALFQRCNTGGPYILLCRSPRATTPLVCGVARPTIVFPDDLADSDGDVVDAVIAHECAHVTRHDVAVTITIEALTAPFAVHPAVAALKRTAAKHREVACDEVAVAHLRMRRTTYASLLLRVAERRAHVAGAVALGAATQLEARVRNLLEAAPARRVSVASQVLVCLCLVTTTAAALLTAIAVDAGWGELSGAWTLDVNESQPRGQLPFRAARLRIDATSDRVHMAQQRTRRDGVDETFEIRRTTDDVPSDVTLPGGMVVRTRARWEDMRLVTNSSAPGGGWREHVEAIATRNSLVIRYENLTDNGRSRYEFVFRRE
jgi:beta-lactamase regulating signal transducer with metallopeptidase domain